LLFNFHFTYFDMNKSTNLKTREQVQAEFKSAGISLSEWARANNFNRMTVVDLLRGARQGLRGETHRCAVALGMKHGEVVDVANFKPAPPRRAKANQAGAAA
jgi:gp16 family phage-associated protein